MKKTAKIVGIVVLMMALVIPTFTSALACSFGVVYCTGGSVNTRVYPSLYARELKTMHCGDTAEYLGKYSIDERGVVWYNIWWRGNDCWVSSRYSQLYLY